MIPLKRICAAKWAVGLLLVVTVTALAQRLTPEQALEQSSTGQQNNKANTISDKSPDSRVTEIPNGADSWTAATAYPTTIARYAFAQVGEDLYVTLLAADEARPVGARGSTA